MGKDFKRISEKLWHKVFVVTNAVQSFHINFVVFSDERSSNTSNVQLIGIYLYLLFFYVSFVQAN